MHMTGGGCSLASCVGVLFCPFYHMFGLHWYRYHKSLRYLGIEHNLFPRAEATSYNVFTICAFVNVATFC